MFDADQATAASYACSAVAAAILVLRLIAARQQPNPFDASFFITVFSLVIVIVRLVVSKYALQYGTVNDYTGKVLTDEILERIRLGTILTLTLRILLTTILWAMCLLLLLLYRRFIAHIYWMKPAILATAALIGVTYLAVVFATFLECRPLHKFWQVSPPPGQCVKALVQVSLQCIGNIIIDFALIGISVPVLFIHGSSSAQRVKLAVLFSLGIFCVVVNCLRLFYTFQQKSAQPARTFWASIAIVVSAFVANAPVIYGSFRLKKAKKTSSSKTQSRRGITTVEVDNMEMNLVDREDLEYKDGITKHTVFSVDRQEADDTDHHKTTRFIRDI
ncbi:hypothetical protein KVT40_006410 [Elsinoe batatas]|uniref:Rhodopsin domain-containing protein n=1 Tax=Elsinoe batatas TaxID=2601811 RepID=A0A8K0PHW0_9PEZI|nr:hypothetical protein KVT40_006410 [Elsinoe batatas]